MEVRAGDEAGCATVDELTMAAPLLVPAGHGVQLQIVLGPLTQAGRRMVTVYSRPDAVAEEPWTRHASGILSPGTPGSPDRALSATIRARSASEKLVISFAQPSSRTGTPKAAMCSFAWRMV